MKIVTVPKREEDSPINFQVFDLVVETLNKAYKPNFKCSVEYREKNLLSAKLYRKSKWYFFTYWTKALQIFVTNNAILMSRQVDLDMVILGYELEKALKEHGFNHQVVYIDYETNNVKE